MMIHELEQHQHAQTIPKGLQISKQVRVTPEYQGHMDALIKEALATFYDTAINGLVEVRRSEIRGLTDEMTTTKNKLHERIEQDIRRLAEAGVVTPITALDTSKAIFDQRLHQQQATIREQCYFKKKALLRKQELFESRRQTSNLNDVMEDPVQKQIDGLRNELKRLQPRRATPKTTQLFPNRRQFFPTKPATLSPTRVSYQSESTQAIPPCFATLTRRRRVNRKTYICTTVEVKHKKSRF